MSEIKRKLVEPLITKKQIISVIVIAALLITVFAFSSYFISLVFGTQREEPSSEHDTAEHQNVDPLEPYFPIDMDWLEDYLDDLDDLNKVRDLLDDIEDLDNPGSIDIEDLMEEITDEQIQDFLENMLDGNVDNYDLTMAGLAIAALLFSDEEAFRLYDYDDPIEDREDILWKYECYDQFNGDEWQSTEGLTESTLQFMDSEDYTDIYLPWGTDLIRLKKPLDVALGSNSFVLGQLFNEQMTPTIIRDSFMATSLGQTLLFKDDLGTNSGDFSFGINDNINMTYNLFGIDLRENDDINNTARSAQYTPIPIKDQFVQLPGGIGNYIASKTNFGVHYGILGAQINSGDNAFVVVNKIRNYLQSNFEYSYEALVNNGPEEGDDVVEWFCTNGEGLSSEFASAFCAFTRAFGVASRFVDGFNSRLIEEIYDNDENEDTYQIKYKNIYNWAEVFIPTNPSGIGKWVQMDILYDSFGEGGAPIQPVNYNLTVVSNSSSYNRGQIANLTATLSSDVGEPIDGIPITFTDTTTGVELGTRNTNSNGIASIEVNCNTDHAVGPNIIEASYLNVENYTSYILYDDVYVDFDENDIDPQEVNVSGTPYRSWAIGDLKESLNDRGVAYAAVSFVLLYKDTNIHVPNAFVDPYTYTDANGHFSTWVEPTVFVPVGEYDLRVDFNGSWVGYPIQYSNINASSNICDYNITKLLTYDLLFDINGRPTEFPNNPDPDTLQILKRTDQLNFSVIVKDTEDQTLVPDVMVEFYDYSNGDVSIGTDISNANGYASILDFVGDSHKSGPTLVYAKVGGVKNYSYYIVNESIEIDVISFTKPLQVDLAGNNLDQFNIQCNLSDNKGNFITNSRINILMNRSIDDYTDYLTGPNPIYPNPFGSNMFDFSKGVILSTPVNNYSLILEFDGYFACSHPDYSFIFNLDYLTNFSIIPNQLKVYDDNDVQIILAVEGNPTRTPAFYDDTYKPEIYSRGEVAHFNVTVIHAGSNPDQDDYVTIWDDYSIFPKLLDTYSFPFINTGYVRFNISTNDFFHAGIHKIRVQYMNYPTINTTFIIINDPVKVHVIPTIDTPRIDNVVLRDSEDFTVSGWVTENGTGLIGLRVRLLLFNKTNNKNESDYLVGSLFAYTNNNGNFTININRIDLNCPYGEYYIRIDFNGSIQISDSPGINLIKYYMNMGNSSSIFVDLNITAGSLITPVDYYTDWELSYPYDWANGDVLYVIGDLNFDNGLAMGGMTVNVTVQYLDGTVIAFNDTAITNGAGRFNASLNVNTRWPRYRSDTMIVVYFVPKDNGINFVEKTETQYP